jgi:hypothetical protein
MPESSTPTVDGQMVRDNLLNSRAKSINFKFYERVLYFQAL